MCGVFVCLFCFVFLCVTGVSVCLSVLGIITHSLCICHLATKLYCIVYILYDLCICMHVLPGSGSENGIEITTKIYLNLFLA